MLWAPAPIGRAEVDFWSPHAHAHALEYAHVLTTWTFTIFLTTPSYWVDCLPETEMSPVLLSDEHFSTREPCIQQRNIHRYVWILRTKRHSEIIYLPSTRIKVWKMTVEILPIFCWRQENTNILFFFLKKIDLLFALRYYEGAIYRKHHLSGSGQWTVWEDQFPWLQVCSFSYRSTLWLHRRHFYLRDI